MDKEKGNQTMIDLRRMRVASLVLRQLNQREIVEALGRVMLNPDTGKPYSLGTINTDIRHLRSEWRQKAISDSNEHRSRVWAELQEVKREAWAQKNLKAVLLCLAQERALLGLDGELPVSSQRVGKIRAADLSDDELAEIIGKV